ncbi:hypothetical protein GCM10023205_82510 [Yinghuangia aomiensis]|uniref:Uncharacterized protein n=1 Tax=Yinghuangia aomiensis TaxID=676205 RepID=A0ABP9IFK9_9ACTN
MDRFLRLVKAVRERDPDGPRRGRPWWLPLDRRVLLVAVYPDAAAERLWIADGALVPVRDRTVAASSRNYRFSANAQVILDADTWLVVATGRPVPGNTADHHATTPPTGLLRQLFWHTAVHLFDSQACVRHGKSTYAVHFGRTRPSAT